MNTHMSDTKFITVGVLAVFFLLGLLIWVLTMPNHQRKPGVYEMPSNEMILHYDYSRDVACYSYGGSLSCVRIPQTDGGK